MKVGTGTPTTNIDPRLVPQNQAVSDVAKDEEQGKDAAKVTLSSSAATLMAIREELANVPEVRAEKVAAIRKEIEAGTYQRSPEETASKMIVRSLIDSLYQK